MQETEYRDVLAEILRKRQAHNCIECGKCSSVCPIGRINEAYYPRIIMRKALYEHPELMDDGLLWSCLNCGRCDEVCDMDVHFYELIRDLRTDYFSRGGQAVFPPHNGGPHAWMKMMTDRGGKQNRLDWLTPDLKVGETGEVLYFVGCLPYYDRFFEKLELKTLDIAKGAVRILNSLGIEPVVMANERCCGHDLLWSGDAADFEQLAGLNMAEIEKTGASRIITACAECYHTLNAEYPKHLEKPVPEVLHMSQFLAENISQLNLKKLERKVSFQDPCRLGRLSGVYDEPRTVMKAMEGVELDEMRSNRSSGVCCGTSGWLSCGTYSKRIQLDRLKEAKEAGAETLVTACPKCQIHFRCALHDQNVEEGYRLGIQDLTTFVAGCLS